MKAYWGFEVQLHPFLTSALGGGEWSLYPHGQSPWYPLDRRLCGPQDRSGRGDKDKNSPAPTGTRKLDHPSRSPALYHRAISPHDT
jgi:hypothetical protein